MFECFIYGSDVSFLGRPIFWLGSSFISIHCATHPDALARANSAVNMVGGNPIALSVIPE